MNCNILQNGVGIIAAGVDVSQSAIDEFFTWIVEDPDNFYYIEVLLHFASNRCICTGSTINDDILQISIASCIALGFVLLCTISKNDSKSQILLNIQNTKELVTRPDNAQCTSNGLAPIEYHSRAPVTYADDGIDLGDAADDWKMDLQQRKEFYDFVTSDQEEQEEYGTIITVLRAEQPQVFAAADTLGVNPLDFTGCLNGWVTQTECSVAHYPKIRWFPVNQYNIHLPSPIKICVMVAGTRAHAEGISNACTHEIPSRYAVHNICHLDDPSYEQWFVNLANTYSEGSAFVLSTRGVCNRIYSVYIYSLVVIASHFSVDLYRVYGLSVGVKLNLVIG